MQLGFCTADVSDVLCGLTDYSDCPCTFQIKWIRKAKTLYFSSASGCFNSLHHIFQYISSQTKLKIHMNPHGLRVICAAFNSSLELVISNLRQGKNKENAAELGIPTWKVGKVSSALSSAHDVRSMFPSILSTVNKISLHY